VTSGQQIIESAITEAQRLQKTLSGPKSVQVQAADDRQIIKATALAWFNSHRSVITQLLGNDPIKPIDDLYRSLLTAAARSTMRTKYLATLKDLKKKLGALQADHVISLVSAPAGNTAFTPDTAPTFAPLVSDARMQAILTKRWQECSVCVGSSAPLAATVMMGGLLEGLLLAKINQLPDKSPVFGAVAAPVDPKTRKTLQLKEWGLKNYIDVAHELGWITKTTKDIGEVMRDYRNYIHPQKELSHGIVLEAGDAQMLWEVAKSITMQLLKP
jgi:hypothetical protein